MKKINICTLLCILLIVFLTGCYGIPIEHNYIGMTKAEVAAHLEKHAFRDRWSGNRFEIEVLQKQMYSRKYKNAAAVTSDDFMMSAKEWRCGFYPQRHWLLGWNGIFAKWYFVNLKFKDGRVIEQRNLRNYYWVYGEAGESPYPQYPKNFHKVNENLYRSGQPDEDEFFSLYTFNGIRSVLNLRENNSDKDEINAINRRWNNAVILYEIPLDTGKISEDDLYKILTVIRDAPKPLLIHCWHGSDRTGCAVAAYRIVFENWSVEDAVSELMKPEYGHHKNIYRNIPELLRKADWKKIRATILNNHYEQEFNRLSQKAGCIGAKIFNNAEWQKYIVSIKNNTDHFEFLLSLFSKTDITKIHICGWENASQGVLAVMIAEKITGRTWLQYDGTNPIINKAIEQAKNTFPQHAALKNILTDPASCRDLQKYFLHMLHYPAEN